MLGQANTLHTPYLSLFSLDLALSPPPSRHHTHRTHTESYFGSGYTPTSYHTIVV